MLYAAIMSTETGVFVCVKNGNLCIPMLRPEVHLRSSLEDLYGAWCESRGAPYGVFCNRMRDDMFDPAYPYENAQFSGETLFKVPNNVAALVIRGSDQELAHCIRKFQADNTGILDFEILDAELTDAEKETLDNFPKSAVPPDTEKMPDTD